MTRLIRPALFVALLCVSLATYADQAKTLYEKGSDAEARQNYEQAFDFYKQAYNLKPKDLKYRASYERTKFLSAASHVHRGQILRDAGLQGLDPAMFNRPKSGFVLPYAEWIPRKLGQSINSTFGDHTAIAKAGLNPYAVNELWYAYQSGQQGLYWTRVWAIYVLIRWCHRHGVFL